MSNAEMICALEKEIHDLLHENMTPDGSCGFDPLRVKTALEFAKLEIEKSIQRQKSETD